MRALSREPDQQQCRLLCLRVGLFLMRDTADGLGTAEWKKGINRGLMRLYLLIPYTRTGEPGPRFIVEDPQACIARNGAEWLADGYVRLTQEPYVPTRIVGDRRKLSS
jgi:hypothetical protein